MHLAIPQQDVFNDGSQPTTAAVLLSVAPTTTLTASQVQSVVYLVSSSVPGLKTSNVTITDSNGTVLNAPGSGAQRGRRCGDPEPADAGLQPAGRRQPAGDDRQGARPGPRGRHRQRGARLHQDEHDDQQLPLQQEGAAGIGIAQHRGLHRHRRGRRRDARLAHDGHHRQQGQRQVQQHQPRGEQRPRHRQQDDGELARSSCRTCTSPSARLDGRRTSTQPRSPRWSAPASGSAPPAATRCRCSPSRSTTPQQRRRRRPPRPRPLRQQRRSRRRSSSAGSSRASWCCCCSASSSPPGWPRASAARRRSPAGEQELGLDLVGPASPGPDIEQLAPVASIVDAAARRRALVAAAETRPGEVASALSGWLSTKER